MKNSCSGQTLPDHWVVIHPVLGGCLLSSPNLGDPVFGFLSEIMQRGDHGLYWGIPLLRLLFEQAVSRRKAENMRILGMEESRAGDSVNYAAYDVLSTISSLANNPQELELRANLAAAGVL